MKNNMPTLGDKYLKLKSITITERPADVDTQKLMALAHKNLKTDTHPALKEWVTRREKQLANSTPYERVRILDNIFDEAIFKSSDEVLSEYEANYAKMYANEARINEVMKTSDTATEQAETSTKESADDSAHNFFDLFEDITGIKSQRAKSPQESNEVVIKLTNGDASRRTFSTFEEAVFAFRYFTNNFGDGIETATVRNYAEQPNQIIFINGETQYLNNDVREEIGGRDWTDAQIVQAANNSSEIARTIRKLGGETAGGVFSYPNARVRQNAVDYLNFKEAEKNNSQKIKDSALKSTESVEENAEDNEAIEREAEEFFFKDEETSQGNTVFIAGIKTSNFPLGTIDPFSAWAEKGISNPLKMFGGVLHTRFDDSQKITRAYQFKTAADRDNFIRKVIENKALQIEVINQKGKSDEQAETSTPIEEKKTTSAQLKTNIEETSTTTEEGESYPAEIRNTAQRQALYDYLGKDTNLTLAVDEAINNSQEPGWWDNPQKQKKIQRGIYRALIKNNWTEKDAEQKTKDIFKNVVTKQAEDFKSGANVSATPSTKTESQATTDNISDKLIAPAKQLVDNGGTVKEYTFNSRSNGENAITNAPNGSIIQIATRKYFGTDKYELRHDFYLVEGNRFLPIKENGEAEGSSFKSIKRMSDEHFGRSIDSIIIAEPPRNGITTSTQGVTAEREETSTTTEATAETITDNQNSGKAEFETGTFTHTKTGEELAEAKLKNKVERDEYLQIAQIAKKHNGKYSKFSKSFLFKSPEDRDAFVQEVLGEPPTPKKSEHPKSKNTIDGILNDAKEKAYKILDANKYPEIKNFVDSEIERGIMQLRLQTVEDYDDFSKMLINGCEQYKAEGKVVRSAVFEVVWKWLGSRTFSQNPKNISREKLKAANKIISEMDEGKLSPEEAYDVMKTFVQTGRRKKISSRTNKETPNEAADTTSNIDDWTDEEIFAAGKTGLTVTTTDGIIRVTRTSQRFRSYTISYEPATELTDPEKKTLTDKIEHTLSNPHIETQGSRIGHTRNPKPMTFVSDPFNYGYNYTPEAARALGLDETKKFVKKLKDAIDGGKLSSKLRNNNTAKSSLRGNGDTSRDNIVEPRTEQQIILQRIGQDIGQRVIFYDNPNKDFHGAHVGNTTFLNVNSEFALPQVFWHETAHWLKLSNPELYRRLVKAAGITQAQREAYLEETKRTDLTTNEAIDEEIIADRLEDVMKRAGFLKDIGRKDQNLIERLIAWLQDMLSKFREYFQNPQGKLTRAQAQRMANEFGRMAQDIVNQRGEKIFRYNAKTHTTELATGEKLSDLYRTSNQRDGGQRTSTTTIAQFGGRIVNDKPVFDNARDEADYQRYVEAERRGEVKLSFAGVKALTANLAKLEEAQRMEADGKSRSAIFKKTGWIKGKDDKWRFEIPDNLDKIDFSKLKRDGTATLGEIYDNPKLYAAYPELKDMPVIVLKLKKIGGYFNANENRIAINKASLKDINFSKRVLVHETQHAIQEIESFARGTTESNARNQARQQLVKIEDEFDGIISGDKNKPPRPLWSLPQKRDLKNELESNTDRVKNLSSQDKHRLNYLIDRYNELLKVYNDGFVHARDNYMNAGGEQEAREVEARATAAERKRALEEMKQNLDDAKTNLETARAELERLKSDATAEQLEALKKLDKLERYQDKHYDELDANKNKKIDLEIVRLEQVIDDDDLLDALDEVQGVERTIEHLKTDIKNFNTGTGTPIIHDKNAWISFYGEKYEVSRPASPIDNQQRFDDNEDAISQRLFDEYLTEGIMNTVSATVEKEIGEYVDLSKMSDPVARDEARDKLPSIRKMLVWYNQNAVQNNSAYKDRLAVRIEYARRCFDNDGRIQNEAVRQTDGNYGQRGEPRIGGEAVSRNVTGRDRISSGRITRGLSRHVSGGKSDAHKHFLKLYDEMAKKMHSERQGAFSSGKKKFAGNGELARHFRNATKLKPDELNGREQKWVELGKSLGVEVVWMDAHTDLKGAVDDGKIYLNRNTSEDTVKTFWHEQFHMLEAANPELHRDLMTYFTGKNAFTREQLDAYREETNRRDLTDEQAVDEILCDNFAQVQKRVKLIREMSADNPSLAGRFVAWLKYLADKVASLFRNPEGGMTTAQRDTFIKAVNDLVKDFGVDSQIQTGLMFSGTVTNLTTKIKTAFTTVKNERTRNHMRKLLERLSGYRIRTGRFAKGIAEVADDVAKVIRSSRAYDWETILPAVGKGIAQQLNINPSDKMNTYIAGWFIDGAPNDNSPEAQEFQRAMREADDMYRNQLLEVREIFDEWNKRTPEEIVRDTIAHGKPEKPLTDKATGFFYNRYSEFVEELYPIKQLVESFEEELHRKLTDDENPYVLLRN
ncbi:MAG: hypothetical protein IKE46_12265, partial [Selenomonadaceae bacterium]|nr:hypothetical protein [Selenomonadaceae bacterium]